MDTGGCIAPRPMPWSADDDAQRWVYAFWHDLALGVGTVTHETLGYAPNRILVIQFYDVTTASSGTARLQVYWNIASPFVGDLVKRMVGERGAVWEN
jgi:hypothetical protein